MIDFLLGIVEFLVTICGFIGNTLLSIIWAITSIPKFVSTLMQLADYCPTPLLVWIEVCIAVTIVFAVIRLLK